NPSQAVSDSLNHAAHDPCALRSSEVILEQAGEACLEAHRQIALIMNIAGRVPPGAAPPPSEKPKRRKVFSGLGKLFSGLVLLSGNAIAIPTVTIGAVTALPILGSLAGG